MRCCEIRDELATIEQEGAGRCDTRSCACTSLYQRQRRVYRTSNGVEPHWLGDSLGLNNNAIVVGGSFVKLRKDHGVERWIAAADARNQAGAVKRYFAAADSYRTVAGNIGHVHLHLQGTIAVASKQAQGIASRWNDSCDGTVRCNCQLQGFNPGFNAAKRITLVENDCDAEVVSASRQVFRNQRERKTGDANAVSRGHVIDVRHHPVCADYHGLAEACTCPAAGYCQRVVLDRKAVSGRSDLRHCPTTECECGQDCRSESHVFATDIIAHWCDP
jgi:hypothetical protein